MDSDLKNFLHNVAWLRKQHGLSKRRMAQLLGIGVYSLSKMERGIFPPRLSIDVFFRIHRSFGIRPADQLTSRLGR